MNNNKVIESKENKYIKEIVKLNTKKYRNEYNKFYVEGRKLLEEVIKFSEKNIESILISKEKLEMGILKIDGKILEKNQIRDKIFIVKNSLIEKITEQKNPEGIITIVKKESKKESELNEKILPVLDGVSDPGNLGTILRTLVATGIKQVVLTEDCTDIYSPKVLRSSMGAVFKIEVIYLKNDELLEMLKSKGYCIYSTEMNGENVYDVDFNSISKKALIFGNEANGVSENIKENTDIHITIPMEKNTESLNLSTSLSVVFYEVYRQKMKK